MPGRNRKESRTKIKVEKKSGKAGRQSFPRKRRSASKRNRNAKPKPADQRHGPEEGKQKSPRQVQQECTAKVMQEMTEIITAVIGKAKEGSFQHAKFLLDFAGVEGAGSGEGSSPEQGGESLAELLLRRLDAAAAGTSASPPASATSCGSLEEGAANATSGSAGGGAKR